MQFLLNRLRHSFALATLVILATSIIPFPTRAASSGGTFSSRRAQSSLIDQDEQAAKPMTGAFVVAEENGNAVCRTATPEEATRIHKSQPAEPLHLISHLDDQGLRPRSTGLQIMLQATTQLEGFPAAKAAFINAAANWENVVTTPITIIVNVDFGPTRFGQEAYPSNVLGSTDGQIVGLSTGYSGVRSALISSAATAGDTTLYNALPQSSVPTDIGSTTQIVSPTATLRALGLLNAVANPGTETAQLGPPPSIGFNSHFQFDFDPTDGITSGDYDFDAVATHEIGHVLGFISQAGALELSPTQPLGVSVWDLYRFRPGTTMATFANASRIQSSGGSQVYYNGGAEESLSTGRPDGSGGDGNQASHWKSVALTGTLVGIMDPSVPIGTRRTISNNDLAALHSFGYGLTTNPSTGPGSGGNVVSLSPETSVSGSITAAPANACALGDTQYTIQVPANATSLTIALTGDQHDALLVRFGQAVAIVNQQAVADFVQNQSSSNQTLTVNAASSPALQPGTYYVALDNCTTSALNYSVIFSMVTTATNTPPSISNLTASLTGNVLTLAGTAADTGGDITDANVVFLDGLGRTIGTTTPFAHNFGTAASASFTIQVPGLQSYPTAVSAALTLIDSGNNSSSPVTAAFGSADTGGPGVRQVFFSARDAAMTIKGGGFKAPVQLEINGVIAGSPVKIKNKGGAKLLVKGTAPQLNLKSGPNRLRVISNGLRSNIFILSL
ncbi:MAG TPA: NF038122 family metalloprotease [Blastocatellia bacterium]|nr:NF038122 family metalloprotease [Blastocatellia bacterium]